MNDGALYLLDDDGDTLDLLRDMSISIVENIYCYQLASHFFEETRIFTENQLLVLDLNMPEMDGIEVMRNLAKKKVSPTLILISGQDQSVLHSAEQLGGAHQLNIFATITKPIKLKNFQNLIQQFFSQKYEHKKFSSRQIENGFTTEELFTALTSEQLVLFYQPQFEMETKRIIGCEALVRWKHPKLGLLQPGQFIDKVENNGWMGLLTGWVLTEAVRQIQIWKDIGYSIPVSVNISAENITTLALPEQISNLLAENKLDANMLCLEVTESALMGELVTSLDILTRLRLKGIGLSIDDFGTGYSSLSQLHKIPFSELKIDQSFVSTMCQDKESSAIVNTCIVLGHELNMKVIAEGVETEQQYNILKKMKCDLFQGYWLAKPMTHKMMTELVMSNKL